MFLVLFLAFVSTSQIWGSILLCIPKLTHPLDFVYSVTLWAMRHFKFGGGVDVCW
jgi:hypothetical protein